MALSTARGHPLPESLPRRISAVIPAYNSAGFIADAIASIRAQTVPVDEIIVVDDGSRDDTARRVRALGDDIRLIEQPNQGPSAARNRGIEAAGGDWIAFLDADDQWLPDRLERQLAVLQRHPDVVLVAGDMREIDERDAVIRDSVLAHHGLREAFDGRPVPRAAARLLEKNFIPTGTVLARRDLLQALGGFRTDIRYGEDLELWVRIALHHPIVMLPEVLMLRRQHGSNATRDEAPMLRDLVRVLLSLRDFDRPALEEQGIDIEAGIAHAWWVLGYHRLNHDDRDEARRAFAAGFRARPSPRTAVFWLLAALPRPLAEGLRRGRRTLKGDS